MFHIITAFVVAGKGRCLWCVMFMYPSAAFACTFALLLADADANRQHTHPLPIKACATACTSCKCPSSAPIHALASSPALFCLPSHPSCLVCSHGVQHHPQPARGPRHGPRCQHGPAGAAQQCSSCAVHVGGAVDAGAAPPGGRAGRPGCVWIVVSRLNIKVGSRAVTCAALPFSALTRDWPLLP